MAEQPLIGFLLRERRSDHGTEGRFFFENFSCYSLEPPWRDNKRNISCIPPDTYDVTVRISPRYGRVYWVMEVPDRTYILIHSGNWGGDTAKGLKTHTNGCLLFGKKRGYLQGQRAVLCSRSAIRKFLDTLQFRSFKLTIIEYFEEV